MRAKHMVCALLVSASFACGDTDMNTGGGDTGPAGPGAGPGPTSTGVGAGTSDGGNGGNTVSNGGMGGMGGMLDCFLDPMTHVEIINACTDADFVEKEEQVGIWDEGDPLPALP